jgi:phosphoribosylformimino-5-aminoimidazole carboxamide ribonucleotide (ProFAR) isomerase
MECLLLAGIEEDLVEALGKWAGIPVTYAGTNPARAHNKSATKQIIAFACAGGVRSLDDLELVAKVGCGRVDVTVIPIFPRLTLQRSPQLTL